MGAERIGWAFAIAVALLTAQAVPALAQFNMAAPGSYQALTQCSENSHSYFPDSIDAPAPVAAALASHADLSFRTCSDLDRNTHYFLRMAWPRTEGVCRYFEREVFPAAAHDEVWPDPQVAHYPGGEAYPPISGWSLRMSRSWERAGYGASSSEAFAAVTDNPCPPAGDAAYFHAPHQSNGMVKMIDNFWRTVTASPQALASAFVNVAGADGATMKRFAAAVFGGKARIDRADCDQYATGCNIVIGADDSYEVTFDIGEHGMILKKLYQFPQI